MGGAAAFAGVVMYVVLRPEQDGRRDALAGAGTAAAVAASFVLMLIAARLVSEFSVAVLSTLFAAGPRAADATARHDIWLVLLAAQLGDLVCWSTTATTSAPPRRTPSSSS